ncbi:MAG TPA: translocation/assembly module TamB domain-containing protein, partial [Acidobacteriota bacterium]|nr:translocation/assembly module TamB domain-containing protein [Acidobacteriota bacterium]
EDKVVVEKLEARSGGGTVTGGGQINQNKTSSNIWLQGKNVAMIYPEGLRSQSDYDLKLTTAGEGFLLSGSVVVLRSIYDQELSLGNPLVRKLMSAKPATTRQNYIENLVKLSLNLRTDSDFTIRNRLMNARLGCGIKVEGTVYRPRLTGKMILREGSIFYIQGRNYEVERASINFFGSDLLEPDLDVEFSTLAQDFNNNSFYEVFIRFGGPLSGIEFRSVRSSPSLSQDQVFSLLTRGTTEGSSNEQAGVLFREQLISAIAGQAFAVPASAIASTIGLSRIQLQQASLNSINDSKTRLVLAKDVTAGFSLIYSFVLDEPQDYTWITSYRYKRNFLVRVIGEEDSTYTASFSHRVQFGKGSGALVETPSEQRDRLNPVISGIELQNQSTISDDQVRKALDVKAGDRYQYWEFQDSIANVEDKIQSLGYLSPTVDLEENKLGSEVQLKLKIASGSPSEMQFHGYNASKKEIQQYRLWWAQGMSASVVQQLVREDLIRRLNLSGYYKAEVTVDTQDAPAKTTYIFNVTPGERYGTVELQFQQISVYKPDELQKTLVKYYPSSKEMFTEAVQDFPEFAKKIEMLYIQRGYLKTAVKPGVLSFESGKITRQVQIEEGPVSKIADLSVSNGEPFPTDLLSKLKVIKGTEFVPANLLDDEIEIHNFYETGGYRDIAVQYSFEYVGNNTDLNIKWAIEKGPQARIASVTVSGNQTTRTDLILKRLHLKPGSVLTLHGQSLAQKRLYDLGVFQQVSLDLEPTDKPGLYDLNVNVIESKRYEAQYGVRYNTRDDFSGEFNYVDSNLFGRAQRLNLYTRISTGTPLFRVDYIQPPAGTLWDNLRISVFRDDRDDDVQARLEGQTIRLPFTIRQTELVVEQPLKLTSHIQVINGFEYGPSHVVTTAEDFPNVESDGTQATFSTSLLGDFRDIPLDATRGSFFSVGLQYAPQIIGSDIVFTRFYGQYFFYKRFGPFVSASGLRMGFLKINSGILSIGEKFRAGGSTTIRGFEQDSVFPNTSVVGVLFGGDSVLILNQEIRFPIFKYVSGAVFYDGGNIYTLASDFDPSNIRNSAGFGVRFGAGGFLLRFDLGYNLQPKEFEPVRVFHFGIGQAF